MNLIKGQISKLLAFEINIGGHSKSMFNVEGGREFLKKQTKMNSGRGSSLSVYSFCEKNFLIFQIAERILTDKLLSIGKSISVFSLVHHIKVVSY